MFSRSNWLLLSVLGVVFLGGVALRLSGVDNTLPTRVTDQPLIDSRFLYGR